MTLIYVDKQSSINQILDIIGLCHSVEILWDMWCGINSTLLKLEIAGPVTFLLHANLYLNDEDIKLNLELNKSFGKYHPVWPKSLNAIFLGLSSCIFWDFIRPKLWA